MVWRLLRVFFTVMRVRLLSLNRRGMRVVGVRGAVCWGTDDEILRLTVGRHERVWVVPR